MSASPQDTRSPKCDDEAEQALGLPKTHLRVLLFPPLSPKWNTFPGCLANSSLLECSLVVTSSRKPILTSHGLSIPSPSLHQATTSCSHSPLCFPVSQHGSLVPALRSLGTPCLQGWLDSSLHPSTPLRAWSRAHGALEVA